MKKQADWDRINQIIELFDKSIWDAYIEYRKDVFSKPKYAVVIRNGGDSMWYWEDVKEYTIDGNISFIMKLKDSNTIYRFDVGKKYEK